MSEAPKDWAFAKIGDVLDGIIAGKNLRCEERPPEAHERGVIKVSAVTWGTFDATQSKTLPDSFEPAPETVIKAGDFLFSRANTLELVGAVVIVDKNYPNLFLSDKVLRLDFAAEVKPWVLKFLRSPEGRRRLAEISSGNQLSMRNIGQSTLKTVSVPIPPIPEQRRIVAKLDRLSLRSAAARDHLARTTTLATRAKQAILDAETVQATVDCGATTIEEIADVIFDGPFGSNLKSEDYTAEGVRVVRLENIGVMEFRAEKITFISEKKYKTLQRHTLHPEDIVFSSFVADDVRAALIPANLGTAINKADCFCLRCDRSVVDPKYLLFRLSARQTYLDMEELVHGATRPRVGLKHLKAYKISLPALEQQKAIVRRIEAALVRIDRMTNEAGRAAHLLDRLDERLLAKAFRGELVPQSPEDEPVEALLTRIREARPTAPKQKRGRRKGKA